jgi:ribosome maturation factor RimP
MLRDQLSDLLRPVVTGLGYELWELEYAPRAGGGLLRLYIDTAGDTTGDAANGITLEDCEQVSRAVSETLDAADPISGSYTLEVSSPGLDRVLRTQAHFERFIGEPVRLEMRQLIAGRKRFSGRLTQVGVGEITLELADGTVRLPIDDIHRARLAPES